MRIVVYCDTLRHVARFARAFADQGAFQLHYLVAPRPRERLTSFTARQIVHAAYAIVVDRNIRLFGLGLTGRLLVCRHPLEDASSVGRVRHLAPDIALHSMDVIYRSAIIAASGTGILNAHIGLLPDFRGRSVFEWSVFYGKPTGVTVFFIDEGVDTGRRIVGFYPVEPPPGASLVQAKTRMFQLAPVMYRRAIEHLRREGSAQENDTARGKRYYVMSRLLLRVVEGALAKPDPWPTSKDGTARS